MKIPPHYDGNCRNLDPNDSALRVAKGEKHVVRFRTPKRESITVVDELRGAITVENEKIDDYILIKSDGQAVYHLAAMVDDYEMKITHVIRGSEWLATFPLHVHILNALTLPLPKFYHLSVFLKPTGKGKMSKRESTQLAKDGFSIFLTDLDQLGYLPEATLNWIALMGWSYDDRTEFFNLPDLVEKFSVSRLNPSPAAINFTKFDHFNGLHIRSLENLELAGRIRPFFEAKGFNVDDPTLLKIAPIIQERIGGLDEAPQIAGFFFAEDIEIDPAQLVGKKMTVQESEAVLQEALSVIRDVVVFDAEGLEKPMRSLVERIGFTAGQVFSILRAAITGQKVSPPLFESMEIVGREKCISRVVHAIETLKSMG